MSAEEIDQLPGPPVAANLMTAAAVYGAANLVTAAIPLLLLPIFVRVLSPEDFGQIAMFSVVQVMLLPLLGLSSKSAVLREYYDDTLELPSLVATSLLILLATTAAAAIFILIAGPWLAPLLHLSVGWIMLAVLATAAQFVISVRLALWQAARTPWPYVSFQVLLAIFNGSISLGLVLATGLGWHGRVLGLSIAVTGFCLVGLWHLRSHGEIRWTPRWRDACNMLRFSAPVALAGVAAAIFAVTDRVFIVNLLGIEQAGSYAVALQLALVVALVTQAFNRAYTPWLFEKLRDGGDASNLQVVRQSYLYFAGLLAVALLVAALSPLAIFVVGARYAQSLELVPYLAVGTAIAGMYSIVLNFIYHARRTMLLLIITAVSAITGVVAMTALIHLNGITGAAQAFVLAQGVLFVMTWWIASLVHPMPWWQGVRSWRGSQGATEFFPVAKD
jgi:O-antigen/teichoic acid export membrane protein